MGAAFNVMILTFFGYVLVWHVRLDVFWVMCALFLAVVFLPMFVASLLTELKPTRIIMPPSYIQALTIGWLFAVIPIGDVYWFLPSVPVAMGLILFAICGAVVNDVLTPRLLGYALRSDDLQMRCFVAHAAIESVQERILADAHRSTIGLQKNPLETEHGTILRTPKSEPRQVLVMLRKGPANDVTEVIITAFFKEQYQIAIPAPAKELAREKALYIEAILKNPEAKVNPILAEEEKDESRLITNREHLVPFIQNHEAIGVFEKISTVSANVWARIGLFAICYAIPIWFYMTRDIPSALGTVASVTVTIAIMSGIQLFKRKTA